MRRRKSSSRHRASHSRRAQAAPDPRKRLRPDCDADSPGSPPRTHPRFRRLTMVRFLALGACGMLASVSVAFAHITLENKEAPVASGYKAVFKVPHGCDGSPTTALKVRIPEGLIDVKPMPKPG